MIREAEDEDNVNSLQRAKTIAHRVSALKIFHIRITAHSNTALK